MQVGFLSLRPTCSTYEFQISQDYIVRKNVVIYSNLLFSFEGWPLSNLHWLPPICWVTNSTAILPLNFKFTLFLPVMFVLPDNAFPRTSHQKHLPVLSPGDSFQTTVIRAITVSQFYYCIAFRSPPSSVSKDSHWHIKTPLTGLAASLRSSSTYSPIQPLKHTSHTPA